MASRRHQKPYHALIWLYENSKMHIIHFRNHPAFNESNTSMTAANNKDIKDIQTTSLRILAEVHNFCTKNDIRYFLIGGTLIGAVRHHGFVPWDDDIDIAMPRPDYEKFLSIAKALPEPFEVQNPNSHTDYIYNYAKTYDTSTTAVETFIKPFIRGVWIDIFPLDGTFNTTTGRVVHFYIIHRLSRLLMYRQKSYTKSENPFKALLQKSHYLLSLLFTRRFLIRSINKTAQIKSFDKSTYVGNLFGRWREKESVKKEVFMESEDYLFSGFTFNGPKDHHTWLSKVYGDYMKLPPIESQKPDHSLTKLDLKKPYKV